MSVPAGYRLERGLLWPASDIRCVQALGTAAALNDVYPYCRAFDVVVQAGGNCGKWPSDLARTFRVVYTFEPDPMNFRCLCANAPEERVFKFNAALGDGNRTIDLDRRPENIGAHQVDGHGDIPMLRIDDLALRSCDLIYLDIEGYELPALRGAEVTIRMHKPVIVVEDKGMSERYGIAKGDVAEWLKDAFGYSIAERMNHDVVMVP